MTTFSVSPVSQGWLYTLQLPVDLGPEGVMPGYLQVDRIVGGDSVESGTLEGFRRRGYALPELPAGAAQGRYWLAGNDAQELAAARALEAWLAEPLVVVRRHPTGGWTHAVRQSEPGVRVLGLPLCGGAGADPACGAHGPDGGDGRVRFLTRYPHGFPC